MNKRKRGKKMELAGRQAVLELRKRKHRQGHPFMINVPALPPGQCYLEHPDGTIEIVSLSASRTDFERVGLLSHQEATRLLKVLKIA